MDFAIMDSALQNKKVLFFDNTKQILFEMDLVTSGLTVKARFESQTPFIVFRIISRNEKIFMFSITGVSVLIFDQIKNKFYIKSGQIKSENFTQINANWVNYNETVYSIPAVIKCNNGRITVSKFNFESEKFSNIDFKAEGEKNGEEVYYLTYPTINEKYLYGGIYQTNKIFVFNLANSTFDVIFLKNGLKLHNAYVDCNKRMWITQTDSAEILELDADGKYKHIALEGIATEPYDFIKEVDNYIVFLPRFNDRLILIESSTMKIKEYRLNIGETDKLNNRSSKCLTCIRCNEEILFLPLGMEHFISINDRSQNMKQVEVWLNLFKRQEDFKSIFYESNQLYGLHSFIKCIGCEE